MVVSFDLSLKEGPGKGEAEVMLGEARGRRDEKEGFSRETRRER